MSSVNRHKHTNGPLVFRGPPRRMVLFGTSPETRQLSFMPDEELSVLLEQAHCSCKLKHNRHGIRSRLKLKLAPTIPAGKYRGELITDEGEKPVELQVESCPRVRIIPAQLSFSGAPGDKVTIEILIVNKGNVEFDLPKNDSVGIYDDDGVETAFASTYRQKDEGIEKFLSHFTQKLRDGHGGLLRLRLQKGRGSIAPGDARTVFVEAQLPSKLKVGYSYHGVWSTALSENLITVSVTE